jgi:DNA-binding response OmpR family regulator
MPVKILIAEDKPSLLETLEYNLLRHGYAVTKAKDGQTANDGLPAGR